ncbi:MAG: NAD(P)-dependent oxidoreductase [Candidatus Omnitrophica bacterium]|nr:NAD(P)-dependent oxidoreductase [Candidatus Omnitrophota bacterium]
MKSKRILITGGSGKLGAYIIEELKNKHQLLVFDRVAPEEKCMKFFKGNILQIKDIEKACCGIDTVIHLAALVGADTPEKIFKTNALGTLNLLESCVKQKVKRVVFASSISCLGFIYQKERLQPHYLPIDEKHPVKPHDAYGLSKLVGEEMCQTYTEKYAIETICLRPPWIWFPHDSKIYESFVKIHEAWPCLLWAYQDARDVARAFCLAVNAKGITHERIFISARDNGTQYTTLDLVKQYYPAVRINKSKLSGNASLIDISKAGKILKYRPRYTWRDIFDLKA